MSSTPTDSANTSQPRWQPIVAIDRRVLGVLAEKAKTTPDKLTPRSMGWSPVAIKRTTATPSPITSPTSWNYR